MSSTTIATEHRTQSVEILYTIRSCWLGWVMMAATMDGICAIALGNTAESLTTQLHQNFPTAHFRQADSDLDVWAEPLLELIEDPRRSVDLPLDIQGTAFQQKVWQALQAIPAGETVSYGELAAQMGYPKAVRAVAAACASNPLALLIPCHRVVGSDGDLKGYRWGRDRKQALLNKEAALSQGQLALNL